MANGIVPARPDLILAGIGLPLVLGGVAAVITSLAIGPALAAGALPAVGALCYALFYSPPEA
jgi:hypothetical protein